MSSSIDSQRLWLVSLERLTYGGDAMGRLPDGRAVFVPFGLPGERVRVRLTEEKRGFARGELVEILETAPDRTTPRCKHFGLCGGCHYQHLPYEEQLKIKADILRDQLTRIGRIETPPVRETVASPGPWNYRNHVQFHLTGEGKLGYMTVETPRAFSISECHLLEGSIDALWPQLEFESGLDFDRVSIRSGADEELLLILESHTPQPPDLEIEAAISIVHLFEENTVVMAGNDHVTVRVLDRGFRVSAGSFFQVNTAMAGRMVEHLVHHLAVSPSDTLLDVYCGAGLFSAFFAPRCERVIGIESSPSACEDFTYNLDEFENVELYEGLAEEVIPGFAGRIANPPYILVDPPRAGLEKRVVDGLLKLSPTMIAYVSCDPATLARDAARLINGGYRLKEVTPFDLFPQTFHIESISLFER